jgi:nitrite reductase (cytochrome c-552)
LIKLNVKFPLSYPDVSTKEKAQKYIGLDMQKLFKEKEEFLKTIVAEWDKKGQKTNY